MPIETAITHEFSHVVIQEITDNAPKWLDEGIASYLANYCFEDERGSEFIKIVIKDKLNKGLIPRIIDLNDFGEKQGFQLAHAFIEFHVIEFGFTKLNILLRNSDDFGKSRLTHKPPSLEAL